MRKTGKKEDNLFYPLVVLELSVEDGGGFMAYAPDLYGCMSDGATPAEAIQNGCLAVQEWIAAMKDLGREVPAPKSAASKFAEERKRLRSLLKRQSKLLAEQDRQFQEIEARIEQLRADVAEALASPSSIPSWFPSGVSARPKLVKTTKVSVAH